MWYRRELEKWQESLETCEIVLPWESFTSISHRYSSD
jgi:chloramphenicol O-acetyltransferase